MKLRSVKLPLLLAPVVIALGGCGLSEKAAELQAQADALQTEYEGMNLSCDFEQVSGEDAAATDAAAALTDEESAASSDECEDAAENYSAIVAEFDADADGELSEDELSDARAGWEEAKLAELDADGDGSISADEKAAWREEKLPARREKMKDRFDAACETLGKTADECRGLRDDHREKAKGAIEARKDEFDTNHDGKLDAAEFAAMRDILQAERDAKRKEAKDKFDADGDGKLSSEEQKARQEDREKKKEEHRPGPPPPQEPDSDAKD